MPDEIPFDPKRPTWDTSMPGQLPDPLAKAFKDSQKLAVTQESLVEAITHLSPEARLCRLEEIHEEAITLANSPAQSFMTPEQHFIHQWQKEKTVAEASLLDAENPDINIEDREGKIIAYSRALVTALYKLGRMEAALEEAMRYDLVDLEEHIDRIQAALEVPDEDLHTHSCDRPLAEMEHRAAQLQVELDRRWSTEEVFSERHGKLAHVWVCVVCGEANATPDTPERQRRYTEQLRAQVHAALKERKVPVSSALLQA